MVREERRIQAQKARKIRKAALLVILILVVFAGYKSVRFAINLFSEDEAESGQNEPDQVQLPYETETDIYAQIPETEPETEIIETEAQLPDQVEVGEINSDKAILLRLSDGKILYEKDAYERTYPASMTKIMTAIITIEKMDSLEQEITLGEDIFTLMNARGASMAGFSPNERVKAVDLLYGAMLSSGAECCLGLAAHLAGSEEAFVGWMNEKAAEIGMTETNFTNSVGLHDDNHYTTAYDMSLLLQYALQNDQFRSIFTATRYVTSATEIHPGTITLNNTMKEKQDDLSLTNGEIIGGKTGYTDEAGLCLASLAQQGGEEYIIISTGADGNYETEQYNIQDAILIYNSIGASAPDPTLDPNENDEIEIQTEPLTEVQGVG